MRRIILFAEDYGHEAFITALITRLAGEQKAEVAIINRSVKGGHGKVLSEFKYFLEELTRGRQSVPDLIVLVTDANCKGYGERRREIADFKDFMICAIPDPHIERWLLLDSAAFKAVFGKGCKAPDQKCERGRYKHLLSEAIQATGIVPPLGGMEYAEDIVKAMDMEQMEQANASLGRFLKELRSVFKKWS